MVPENVNYTRLVGYTDEFLAKNYTSFDRYSKSLSLLKTDENTTWRLFDVDQDTF